MKPQLKPKLNTVPDKPTSYMLKLSRPIDSYDSYKEIFAIKIVEVGGDKGLALNKSSAVTT